MEIKTYDEILNFLIKEQIEEKTPFQLLNEWSLTHTVEFQDVPLILSILNTIQKHPNIIKEDKNDTSNKFVN